MAQIQMVQDTNSILEQWRVHYEHEIVELQLKKVEIEDNYKEKLARSEEKHGAVSLALYDASLLINIPTLRLCFTILHDDFIYNCMHVTVTNLTVCGWCVSYLRTLLMKQTLELFIVHIPFLINV